MKKYKLSNCVFPKINQLIIKDTLIGIVREHNLNQCIVMILNNKEYCDDILGKGLLSLNVNDQWKYITLDELYEMYTHENLCKIIVDGYSKFIKKIDSMPY